MGFTVSIGFAIIGAVLALGSISTSLKHKNDVGYWLGFAQFALFCFIAVMR